MNYHMQKLHYTLCLLFFIVPIIGFAQAYSAQNQVNVMITPVQNISIAQPSVSLPLTTAAQYVSGSTSAQQINHIKIVSTVTYQVSVRAQQRFLFFEGGSSTIPVNSIEVKASAGADLTGNGVPISSETQIVPAVALSETETVFISHAPPEGGRAYNVIYAIPAAKTAYYFNQAAGTYTATIIYTISAQ